MDWLNNLFATKSKRIFMDYASATPVHLEVREAMEKYWSENFYNPSAIYKEGLGVKRVVEDCRARVADVVGAGRQEIIFTASGTESNNLAILGAFEEARSTFKRPHIIISAIEHAAVIRSAEEVARRGGEMTLLPVNEEGLVSLERLKLAMKPNTFMVSVGLANSEIGVVQPIAKIGRAIRALRKEKTETMRKPWAYPLLHTDASATPSYLPVNLESLQCDLLTLDGSKIYGPKGIGILAVRRGVKVRPLVVGGGQERGMRGGTQNIPLIVGFTLALEITVKEREKESERLDVLRKQFLTLISKHVPEVVINGSLENYLPNIVSVSVPDVLAEFLLLKLDSLGVMVSVGTACSLDERVSGSPVIRALGKEDLAESTLRFSFGRYTTQNDIKKAAEIFCGEAKNLLK